MPDTSTRFDFKKRVAYDADAKRRFHRHARAQLLKLAEALGLEPHEYDLRSNAGGIAVSGEITLHADHLYVQASQSATGADTGILFRSCDGRRDYTGGRNNFASLDLLHRPGRTRRADPPSCAAHCRRGRRGMSTKKLDPAVLAQFTGSEHWYRHGLVRGILFTDGAKYVADAGGAYWLIDEIAIAQRFEKAVSVEEFQVWKLTVNSDRTAKLACEDGNGRTVFEKAIEYTDFPADGIELWFENSTIYPAWGEGSVGRGGVWGGGRGVSGWWMEGGMEGGGGRGSGGRGIVGGEGAEGESAVVVVMRVEGVGGGVGRLVGGT